MIIVSGASRGIGNAIYNHLKKLNKKVIGISKSKSEDPLIYQCDISDFSELQNLVSIIKKTNKSIYAYINAAGTASMNLALATPESVSRNIVNTNLLGTIFSNQLLSPLIIRNKLGGRIINFSTLAVKLSLKGESVYIASKAGVEAYSKSLARELSGFQITVNCIAPGPIKTDLLKGVSEQQINNIVQQQIIPQVCDVKDIVNQVDLLLSKKADKISGQVINVGGY